MLHLPGSRAGAVCYNLESAKPYFPTPKQRVEWSGHWSKTQRIQGHARSTVGIEGEDADSFP